MNTKATFERSKSQFNIAGAFSTLCAFGFVIAYSGIAVGQTAPGPVPTSAAATSQSTIIRQTRAHKHHKSKAASEVKAAPVIPPVPPKPDWPADAAAKPADVAWNGHELTITATNSSLDQILRDVSTATGVKIEGASGDQRIYGNYGPAPARDVLSSLLDGTGYNLIMVGDRGKGIPLELSLTRKATISRGPTSSVGQSQNNDDEAPEEPETVEQPVQPRPFTPPVNQPSAPKTPQMMLQEIQQRQLQLQQQQQQQQPQPQGQPPSQPEEQ